MIGFILLASISTHAVPAVPPPPPVAASAALKPVDPAALAAAKKLMRMMQMQQTIEHSMHSLVPILGSAFVGKLAENPAARDMMQTIEKAPDGRQKLGQIFGEEMLRVFRESYPEIEDASAREYAGAFTTRELDDLSTFFSSGVGAKWLERSPQLQQAIGQAAQSVGMRAGMVAGGRTIERAAKEILPSSKPSS